MERKYSSTFVLILSLIIPIQGQNFQKLLVAGSAHSTVQTSDGGYITTGKFFVPGNNNDVYLFKTDASGNALWSKTYNFDKSNIGYSVRSTSDGGFIVTGVTNDAGDKICIFKTTSTGNITWSKTFSIGGASIGYAVEETSDNGFIIASDLGSLIKTDASGTITWAKSYSNSKIYSVKETPDNGFVFTGSTTSGAGGGDIIIVKTDNIGAIVWSKVVGGTGIDYGNGIINTSDGGFAVTGAATGFSPGAASADAFLIKLNSNGNILSTKIIGNTAKSTTAGNNWGTSLTQTSDNGFVMSEYGGLNTTYSNVLYKVSSAGTLLWSKNYDVGTSGITTLTNYISKTSDGGFVLSKGDGYIIKTDNNGNAGCDQIAEALTISDFYPTVTGVTVTASNLVPTVTNPAISTATTQNFTPVNYTPSPVSVDAGIDQTICVGQDAVLEAVVVGATGGTWSGGTGTYTPSNSASTNYTPSPANDNAGSVTLTITTTGNGKCTPASDNIIITIIPLPSPANAGPDQVICSTSATLAANTPAVGTGQWSVISGTATITSPSSPNSTVTGLGVGNCVLRWTTSTPCGFYIDQMTITNNRAVVNAGADNMICRNGNVTLNGSINGASGGTWSGGTGTYNANANTLNAIYTPSAAEYSAGTITLTLTSTGNAGSCGAVTDQVIFTIVNPAVVNAGADNTLCQNGNVILNGSVSGASGGTWSGGTGTYSPNQNTLNATYTPSAAEYSAGVITLTLTSTGNVICSAVSDQVSFTITDQATVNAGADGMICENGNVTLNGSVSGASGGTWSGGSGTYNPDQNTLNATYTPSAAEILAGAFTLTLTSTGNGSCIAVSDAVTFTINTCMGNQNSTDPEFITLHPNPSSGIFHLSLGNKITGTTELLLLNPSGNILLEQKLDNSSGYEDDFDLSSYSKGIYFLQIKTKEAVIYKKIIIQ